ncbi:MAG: sugar phosphate isomerase/epimerase [Clostridia bacterium]|nr:sugar phosphate isomerase/epimerase [Clostridia bacterium]
MMHRVLCSTGALIGRPNGRDYRLLEKCRDQIKCDGYEFMFYDTWYPEHREIQAFLKAIQLPVIAWHCEKRIGQDIAPGTMEGDRAAREKFLINCRMAGALGAEKMVIHLWDGPISDSRIENNIAAFSWLRKIAMEHGLDLMVENVVCAYQDPLTHWRMLQQVYPDIHFTFDTKMAAFHDQMPLSCSEEYRWLWDHIRHLHVNDYGGGYLDWQNLKTLHIGKGKIDFEAFWVFLKQIGYAGDFTVEATSFGADGVIYFQALNDSLDWIRQHEWK